MAASETNKQLAGMFATMARVLDLKGGGFRAISFQKVSRLLDEMPQDVKSLYSTRAASRRSRPSRALASRAARSSPIG